MKRRVKLLFVALAACSLVGSCRSGERQSAQQFVDRWRLLYNSHDLPGFTNLYAKEGPYVVPGMRVPVGSRQDLRTAMDRLWRSTPDIHITSTRPLIVDDDQVAFIWEMTLTPPGATRPTQLVGACFLVVREGVIQHQASITGS